MTDRLHALTVTLERDIREDDAEALIAAIQQLRGVAAVHGIVTGFADHVARVRAKRELADRLLAVLQEEA